MTTIKNKHRQLNQAFNFISLASLLEPLSHKKSMIQQRQSTMLVTIICVSSSSIFASEQAMWMLCQPFADDYFPVAWIRRIEIFPGTFRVPFSSS